MNFTFNLTNIRLRLKVWGPLGKYLFLPLVVPSVWRCLWAKEIKMRAALLLALLLSFVSLCANLVTNQPTEYTQPDGTVLSLLVSGDEYYHRVHDELGYTILLHPNTGYAVYAVPDGNSIKPSEYVVGRTDPAALGIQPNLMKDTSLARSLAADLQRSRDAGNKGSPVGTFNNIMAFVRFSGQTAFPSTPTYATYNNQFMSTTQQSLADYYDEVSDGQLDINSYLYPYSTGVVLSYQVTHIRGYYSPYNAATNPTGYTSDLEAQNRRRALVTELIGYLNPDIPDGLDTDTDNDGIIDGIMFLFRGLPDDWGDLLWPAHWSGSYVCGTINGANVTHYIFEFEGSAPPTGVSVLCHEMGHNIGFPDLYHYTNNGINPVAYWDLMAADNAQHELTYMKLKYGTWFSTLPTITPTSTPTTYTLTAIDQSPYSCYRINSNSANQFYMLEYRRDTGRYEIGIPGSGLIVYRVIDTFAGEDIDGNAAGPPDEIYVYRPNGDIDTDGSYNSAHFSSTVSRTKIHTGANPEPWRYSDAGTQLDGNLVITDIGASGGTTITFKVRDSVPNIWDGSSSTAWNTDANWSLNHVPTATEDVEIPSLIARYPIVSAYQACRSLLVADGASVTISTGTLSVTQDFVNYGTLAISNSAGNLYVQEDLIFEDGSDTDISADGEIYVQSDVEFRAGSSVNMTYGYLEFYGTGASYFRTYVASAVNHLRSDKDSPNVFGFSAVSTATLTINGNFWTYEGSTSTHPYTGTTIIKGSLNSNYTGSVVHFGGGTLSFEGASAANISFLGADNYLNSLKINKSAGVSVYLLYPAEVKGNFTLQSGVFNPQSNTFTVGGNWVNSVGATAFIEGTGTVVFNGSAHQYCNSTENFSTLVVNKSGSALRVNNSTAVVTCAYYSWVAGAVDVLVGTFTANDLTADGIEGNFYNNSGGTINLYQDSSHFIDLNGYFYNYGGTINIYGGSMSSYWAYAANAGITMTGGVIDFKNRGITIYPEPYTLTINVTGGTIRTVSWFSDSRGAVVFAGGTVELYGSGDASVTQGAESAFYNLTINKSGAKSGAQSIAAQPILFQPRNHEPEPDNDTRLNNVTIGSDLLINNNLTISTGTLTNSTYAISIFGDWVNSVGPAAYVPGTGTVYFAKVGDLQNVVGSTNFYNVTNNHTGAALTFQDATGISGTLVVNNIVAFQDANTIGTVDNSAAGGILAFYYDHSTSIGNYTGGGALRAFYSHHVIIADLTQNGLYGSFIADTGHLEFHQDAGNWIDLNGNMTITNNGIVDIYGGNLDSYIPYSANASLTMDSGEFNVKDHGIYIFSTASYTCDFNISGGIIRANGNWRDDRGNFDPTGGSVELTGATDNTVTSHADSWFWTLKVNKVATRGTAEPEFSTDREGNVSPVTRSCNLSIGACTVKAGFTIDAANVVYLAGTMTSLNAGAVTVNDGSFRLNGYNLVSSGNVVINGILAVDPASSLQMYSTRVIDVNSGGYLLLGGSNISAATVSHYSTGYYTLNINSGGALGGIYGIFEWMDAGGVYLKAGSSVDSTYPLNYCTFRNGAAGGRLLRIDTSQSFTVNNASFPTATGSYNVQKSLDSGLVYFANWSGTFGGPAFEQDAFNRVYWTGSGYPNIKDITIQYIPATTRIQLDWTTYPFPVTEYRIYRSTAPDGTFTQVGTSATNTWSEVVPGNYYFYKVRAVFP